MTNMATAYAINVTPENTGLWQFGQNEAAAKKASELLQEDMEVSGWFICRVSETCF